MSISRKSFSLLLTAVIGFSLSAPSFASVDKKDKKVEGVKGLFYEQLASPSKDINTGVQYWIKLKRDGEKVRVTNKQDFRSGDQIWFCVKSNIKGYAYILLSGGSRGEQSVLFPDPSVSESNKITPGVTYTLPSQGALTFDENPGLEKVTLLVSRHPIDAQAYLNKPSQQQTLIASAMTGAKDLVPAKVLVSIEPVTSSSIVVAKHPASATTKIASADTKKSTPKVKKTAPKIKIASNNVKKNSNEAKHPIKKKDKKVYVAHNKSKPLYGTKGNEFQDIQEDSGTVTVVSQATGKGDILHVDVQLHHI